MDISIVTKAGITKSEFARIMRTSRTTVHSWMSGGGVHAMIVGRLRRMMTIIGKAVEAGDLPLAKDMPRKDRAHAIAAALKKHNTASAD